MNLGVFNRVNSNQKEDKTLQWDRMYGDWSSFCYAFQSNQLPNKSVLTTLPMSPDGAKQIVTLVVQPIAANIGITLPAPLSKLNTDKEVNWCMEVICYGLSLPLNDHDAIRDCVHIYCEWLSALLPNPKIAVPQPIIKQPNHFARKIISHLHHLFMPRPGDATDMINRQAVLCHRVLRTIQNVVIQSEVLDQDTWESLLLLLLAINDLLLAPPTVQDDIGDQLCDRVLSVLLEVWLQACARCFPSPRMWKTLSELAQTWRHRISLITQWNRINVALTQRLLKDMYGPSFPNIAVPAEDKALVPANLVGEMLAQTWYRLLHCIGNPVQLARPGVISQTHKFLQFAIVSSQLTDPSQHPCLTALPIIFVQAMKGVSTLVDAFLGLPAWHAPPSGPYGRTSINYTRQLSQPTSAGHLNSILSAPYRARCNSILHLFGSWLFEAALLGCDLSSRSTTEGGRLSSPLLTDRSRASSVSAASEQSMPFSRPRSATVVDLPGDNPTSTIIPSEAYENGRAEAIGVLCRIFCSKKTDEDILPTYLSRFYIVLQHALRVKELRLSTLEKYINESVASVLLYSADLLRVDLDGVCTLLPSIIDALETVLTNKDMRVRYIDRTELRRASIHILISLLSLPLHYQQLHIKELSSVDRNPLTFIQLRPRLTSLLLSALQVEADSTNIHLLLGGLACFIHELSSFEKTGHVLTTQTAHEFLVGQHQVDSASNVLSTSDTHSCHSTSSTSYPSMSETTLDSHNEHDTSFSGYSYHAPTITFPLWSFSGLAVHAAHLVSSKLISSWKGDLNTSLAALEMLASLARIGETGQNIGESRRIVQVLCEYISLQCSRPPQAHSKDLHSTIVAAFNCCGAWLFAHPYLSTDQECLHSVLQVIELGISGSKSQGKVGEAPKMKHDKELKPVSLRVRDAAELLLTSLVEKVGNFPSPCGAHSTSCLLDEGSLLHQSPRANKQLWSSDVETAVKHFRYFATSEGTILLSVLEQPLGNDQDSQPSVTLLLRNPFGRHVWTSQLRHLPRNKCGFHSLNNNPGRPLPMNDVDVKSDFEPQYFPDSVDRARPCLADKSIPGLDSHPTLDDEAMSELDVLGKLVDACVSEKLAMDSNTAGIQMDNEECKPPPLCQEFQTARLFLSHLGFISLDNLQGHELSRGGALVRLDSLAPNFCHDLETLDRIGCRTHDTLFVFYVRSGQKNSEEILSNVMSSSSVDDHFVEFLQTLGWSVDVKNHPGWTGFAHAAPAHRAKRCSMDDMTQNVNENVAGETDDCYTEHGGSIYNGASRVLYWADGFSEIAFVVPTPSTGAVATQQTQAFERSSPQRRSVRRSHAASEEADTQRSRLAKPVGANASNADIKMMVVWLESFEDHQNLPIGDLLAATQSGTEAAGSAANIDRVNECYVIFIHALKSGLYRIHLKGPASRINVATPLVDGMVVSRRVLGPLVRQTALNMAKRRRLDQESYQLPHVRRKLKIQELASRYRAELKASEFYTALFSS